MPIDKIAIYWHIFLPFWQLGRYFNYTIELMKRLCHSSAKLRFGDILLFEYHLDEDTDKHSNYSELDEEVV